MNDTIPPKLSHLETNTAPPIPEYFHTHSLKHAYGGNGLMFIKEAESEGEFRYALVTEPGFRRVYVARADLLSKERKKINGELIDLPLEPEEVRKLEELRADLASGVKLIRNGFVILRKL